MALTPIAAAVQESSPGAFVELFKLDLAPLGGPVLPFCTSSLPDGSSPSFGGLIYQAIPCQADGFQRAGSGSIARPKFRLANVKRTALSLMLEFNDLIGAKLQRIRTFARYLDNGEMPDGEQHLGIEEYIVSRKSAANRVFVEWELRAAIDLDNVKIPKGQVQRTCRFVYRRWNPQTLTLDYADGTVACQYTGDSYFDLHDQPTTIDLDRCSKRLSGCRARFGINNPLPFGGMPGAARVR